MSHSVDTMKTTITIYRQRGRNQETECNKLKQYKDVIHVLLLLAINTVMWKKHFMFYFQSAMDVIVIGKNLIKLFFFYSKCRR